MFHLFTLSNIFRYSLFCCSSLSPFFEGQSIFATLATHTALNSFLCFAAVPAFLVFPAGFTEAEKPVQNINKLINSIIFDFIIPPFCYIIKNVKSYKTDLSVL